MLCMKFLKTSSILLFLVVRATDSPSGMGSSYSRGITFGCFCDFRSAVASSIFLLGDCVADGFTTASL